MCRPDHTIAGLIARGNLPVNLIIMNLFAVIDLNYFQ